MLRFSLSCHSACCNKPSVAAAVQAGSCSCCAHLYLMPSTPCERIDRLARHLSASGARSTTLTAVSSAMATQVTRQPITSHALDTATGKPARRLPLKLERLGGATGGGWSTLGVATTDEDGRAPGLLGHGTELVKGTYRVTFDTETYFRAKGAPCFYPEVAVMFRVEDPSEHFHIPLLLSPFGYSTYRGS